MVAGAHGLEPLNGLLRPLDIGGVVVVGHVCLELLLLGAVVLLSEDLLLEVLVEVVHLLVAAHIRVEGVVGEYLIEVLGGLNQLLYFPLVLVVPECVVERYLVLGVGVVAELDLVLILDLDIHELVLGGLLRLLGCVLVLNPQTQIVYLIVCHVEVGTFSRLVRLPIHIEHQLPVDTLVGERGVDLAGGGRCVHLVF